MESRQLNGDPQGATVRKPYLSVVLPAYDEEERLGVSLPRILEYLSTRNWSFEILVVDDGSSDRTSDVARDRLNGIPHKILRNDPNRGKGYSVKRGVLEASGRYVLFSDTDLSTPIQEVEKLIQALETGADVAIGSRALKDSRIERHQPWCREILGKIFNRFLRMLVMRDLHDTQCGFKCFRQEVIQPVFSRQTLDGWAFDVEVLYVARKLGYHIAEVPVRWINSDVTKVNPLSDGMKMVWDAWRVRRIHADLSTPASLQGGRAKKKGSSND
ncbi:MAG: glycosyltransferase family 2 protein [Candidatus Eisenbacteria sp.]|nr:glycosyltransferase family 2 protein [Candidatus Eisenbacteria bacterium]